MTAQGHPRARFQRAIEGRWVFHAELAAREAGNLTLAEALELVVPLRGGGAGEVRAGRVAVARQVRDGVVAVAACGRRLPSLPWASCAEGARRRSGS